MRAALQAALKIFRPSTWASKQSAGPQEVTITVRPGIDAEVIPIEKKFTYPVFEPGGRYDGDRRRGMYIDPVPTPLQVVKLSPHLTNKVISHLKADEIVRLYFGAKTLKESNPLVDAFTHGSGNGMAYNFRINDDVIPHGEEILHEQTSNVIRAQAGKSVKFTKVSTLDKKLKLHCYLKMETAHFD